jgi:endonuclease III
MQRKDVAQRMPTTTKAEQLLNRLEEIYPEAECALHYQSPWQLLVATILSAQCTDIRVNQVTKELFAKFPTPVEMAAAALEDVEAVIRPTGFYRNKARHLTESAHLLLQKHSGQVPPCLEAMTALPGVGRKTANVVLGNVFDIPGMVVDTHVKRLSRRFGWTQANDPVEIEKELCTLLPQQRWTQCGHTLIAHGRSCCKARTPFCSRCPIAALCPKIGVAKSH